MFIGRVSIYATEEPFWTTLNKRKRGLFTDPLKKENDKTSLKSEKMRINSTQYKEY